MKIINRNDLLARRVLAEVKRLAKKSKDDCYVLVETYSNCREQGFALASCDAFKVAFAENRNSDDLVLYRGSRLDFENNSNIPSDEAYESRLYFSPNNVKKAAKFIVKYLES
jgi:hypothetical protein